MSSRHPRKVTIGQARLKAFAIFARPDVEMASKGAPHPFQGCEAAELRNRWQRKPCLFETASRRLDARVVDEARRRHASLGAKTTRKIARAHGNLFRERFNRKVFARIAEIHDFSSTMSLQFVVSPCKKGVNCVCPPGRRRKTTIVAAMRRGTSRPRSSSISASARSRPAVIPPEV